MHKIRNLDESMKTSMFVCACVVYECIIVLKLEKWTFIEKHEKCKLIF